MLVTSKGGNIMKSWLRKVAKELAKFLARKLAEFLAEKGK